MTVRRLLCAFLLSIVVGIFVNSVSEAASFQNVQSGVGAVPEIFLGHAYDADSNFSSDNGSGFRLTTASGGVSTSISWEAWANTPSVAGAVAADEGGSTLGDLAESCATNSFTAGTMVLMADGSLLPISKIVVGDKVEATDPTTGKTVAATVSHLFINDDHNLAEVTVRDAGAATATLDATQGHRFWDVTRDAWVVTDQLADGDQLLSDTGA
jgi:hypothetical protein